MPYDATKLKDWQIAELAEEKLPSTEQWRDILGLSKDEMIPYGRTPKLDFLKIIDRLQGRPDGKYIEVTAISEIVTVLKTRSLIQQIFFMSYFEHLSASY